MSIVIVSILGFPPPYAKEAESAGQAFINLARAWPSCREISLHKSVDRNETMIYGEWVSEASYLAFMQDSATTQMMQNYSSLFEDPDVTFSMQQYVKVAK